MLSSNIYLQADHNCQASRWDWCCLPIFTYKQIIIAQHGKQMGMMLSVSIYLQADHHCPASRRDWWCLPVFTYKQIIIARAADGTDVVWQYLPTSRSSLPGKQMGLMMSASIYLQADHHCSGSRWDWRCLPVFTYKQIIIARQADGTDVVCQYLPTSRSSLPGKQMGLMLSAKRTRVSVLTRAMSFS